MPAASHSDISLKARVARIEDTQLAVAVMQMIPACIPWQARWIEAFSFITRHQWVLVLATKPLASRDKLCEAVAVDAAFTRYVGPTLLHGRGTHVAHEGFFGFWTCAQRSYEMSFQLKLEIRCVEKKTSVRRTGRQVYQYDNHMTNKYATRVPNLSRQASIFFVLLFSRCPHVI